jgi:hypothetical protein
MWWAPGGHVGDALMLVQRGGEHQLGRVNATKIIQSQFSAHHLS